MINLSDPSAPGRTQSLQVHIPAGIDDGQSIRLRGKGIVSMKDSKVFGDQYAVVEIQVPTTLTPQAARKLREFEAECAKTSGTSNGTHAA